MTRKNTQSRLTTGKICLLLAFAALFAGGCQPHPTADSWNTTPSDTTSDGSRIFHLMSAGSKIDLTITPGKLNVTDADIVNWVRRSAMAHVHYFGHFPIPHAHITILAAEVGPIGDGLTTNEGIRITVGPEAHKADLDNDWIMVHEMFHLAFPDMDDRYIWLREGLASYLEPFARARVGTIAIDQVWKDLYEGLPQGQPQPGDRGLDNTHTRESVYWGGSMFCFLADLRIREQTHNAKSLDTAMRAILDQGGNRFAHWTMDQVLKSCDQSTGTTVMSDLYKEMGNKPKTVDLHALWKRLGVRVVHGRVIYDNTAPLAQIRVSMTEP
ncbi:MAG TPA: hypothetical protein VFE47_18670 [Tepidisphaeraceae bacterium]|nr:hypothetical protein [Tepidisphaeraceae bacterium]